MTALRRKGDDGIGPWGAAFGAANVKPCEWKATVSISLYLDEYLARRGITPDDTVVADDPCAVFHGAVEEGGFIVGNPGVASARLLGIAETVRDLLR